jgi:hypothetical protein
MLPTWNVIRAHVVSAFKAGPLSRTEARRLRAVEREPELATIEDVHLLLVAHGVVGERLRHCGLALEQLPVPAAALWAWVMQYDGIELAELLASDLPGEEIVAHLELRTVPPGLARHQDLAS